MTDSNSDREPIERLAESFLARFRAGERPSLTEFTAAHPDLAHEIRALFPALIQMEQAGSAIDEGAVGTGLLDSKRPESLGGYRIIREIGRGGMGVVYEAEQETLGRRVALKVLPSGLADDARARARFDREARAAAKLHHTNIVPVFDVGHADGRDYYAMQMIRGQGLDAVIAEVKRFRGQGGGPAPATSIAASLVLGRFTAEELAGTDQGGGGAGSAGPTADYPGSAPSSAVLPGQSDLASAVEDRRTYYRGVARVGQQVAAGLTYAHARGVIHRDIKPSNLLLDTTGIVWVTDFGLAKTGDLGMTASGDILGTIRYMAPERFRGECDARADIYALGLTLYELLTLEPAFSSADRLELIERIRREEPVPLRSLDRKVPRDLETIVLKAIAKEPRQRYPSAEELGEDLQRFLADEPVQARRIGVAERSVRWARRNPAVAGLAAAVFLVMGAGTAVSAWQATRARTAEAAALKSAAAEKQQRAAAEEQEAETRVVLEFVENKIFAAARPEGQEGGLGREVSLRKALESSLPHIAESFRTLPLVEARLRQTLGKSFLFLGEPRVAQEQLQAARALYTKYRGPDHRETLASMRLLAQSYYDLGKYGDALNLREETLALHKAKLGPDHPDTLRSMMGLALSYRHAGRHADAIKLNEYVLALRTATLGPEHHDTLESMSNLAGTYSIVGRHADALKLNEEVLALWKAKLGPDHPDTLVIMNNLAGDYYALGRSSDALKLIEETLALRKAKLGPEHYETLGSMSNLAKAYAAVGRHADALKLNEDLLALCKATLGPEHPDTLMSMNNLAGEYYALGRSSDALKLIEETLALRKAKLGPEHPDTLSSMFNLAATYSAMGRHADALKLNEDVLALWKAKLGPDHPDTLVIMNNLASDYYAVGRSNDALKLNEDVLALRKVKLGRDHPDTLLSQMKVATSLLQLGRATDGLALCRQACELWEKRHRSDSNSLYDAACFRALAAAVIRAGDRSPEGAKQASAEADRAMAWLKQAASAEFSNAAHMEADHDLDALRDRDDFKELVGRLKSRKHDDTAQ
jgi:serine/threonine protein kinase